MFLRRLTLVGRGGIVTGDLGPPTSRLDDFRDVGGSGEATPPREGSSGQFTDDSIIRGLDSTDPGNSPGCEQHALAGENGSNTHTTLSDRAHHLFPPCGITQCGQLMVLQPSARKRPNSPFDKSAPCKIN